MPYGIFGDYFDSPNNSPGPRPSPPLAGPTFASPPPNSALQPPNYFTLASAAAQAERNLMAQQVSLRQTYEALTGAGVPNDEALAAVVNPSLMHALAVKYLGPKA